MPALTGIKKLIQGFGLLGRPRQPTTEEDSGISTSRAVLIDLISEGPIEGIIGANRKEGIYFDRTPVRSPGQSKDNFPGFRYVFRRGGINQRPIPAFAGKGTISIGNETEVGIQVKQSTGAVTRTIINPELDLIGIRFNVTLQEFTSKGDTKANELRWIISIKEGSAPWRERLNQKVEYKFASPVEFHRQFRVNNQGGTVDTYQVKIEITTEDGDPERHVRVFRWLSYTEITTDKLNYRHSSAIAMEFLAKQFNAVPERAYKVAGRLVPIPSNATVMGDRGLNFDGPWDGQFNFVPGKACSDPVWQLYDLLTNGRYGLRRYIPRASIDIWSLYEISRYNNQMVPNGQGGNERRYRCNVQLQSKEGAWNVLNAFCSACNMKAYYAEGTIYFWQDRPGDVVRQFTQADVENGEFIYSTTAVRSRYTVALVSWNDPKDFYRRNVETVEDPEGIDRYGIRDTEITAFGCTSRSQAIRMGKWALFSSQYETQTVTFACRSWAAYVRPGEIIQVADAKRANISLGGLIREATETKVWLDRSVSAAAAGGISAVSVMLPDGSLERRENFEFAIDEEERSIEFYNPLSSAPNVESNFIFHASDVSPQLFRVLSVTPATSDPTRVEITGIQYYAGKYDLLERDEPIEEEDDRFELPEVVSPPRNVRSKLITITEANGTIRYALQATWERGRLPNGEDDASIAGYRAEFALNNSTDWQGTLQVTGDQFEARFENLPYESYQVRVSAVDFSGRFSTWVTSNIDITLRLNWGDGRRLSIWTKAA